MLCCCGDPTTVFCNLDVTNIPLARQLVTLASSWGREKTTLKQVMSSKGADGKCKNREAGSQVLALGNC